MADRTDIYVYADWIGMAGPKLIGTLSAQQAKGRKSFSFMYNGGWIASHEQFLLDPDIAWFGGAQYPNQKENFGVFLDSMPDTWGRTLMKRRASILAKQNGKQTPTLYDIDFLLGVHDESRMGALRFKLDPDGPFLNNDTVSPTPPWATIRELQHGAELIESNEDTAEVRKWLAMLMAPGSSLGGARPKANILDEKGQPWIAKFPSKNDTIDRAAWEYLAYRLAINAGIEMAESKLEHVAGKYHTFFTKRFDRVKSSRIHFASAMTMTGKNEELIRDDIPSYLDIVEFIQFLGANVAEDLAQLWRRMVFNILISNTDDHLRNHGFLLTSSGWRLSPAFDINPSIDKDGLALNIDMDSNQLDLDLAKQVGVYFRLGEKEMDGIIDQVKSAVADWQKLASEIGISRGEQTLMAAAFRL
ncbi:type II toxin-antitoxin system HipA family toxin [Dyadobacter psychrophilus]|jgi:serine/threonine-protein kinase HipA|uniref:Serine/threonine-protein kinase HipA n=1 Tax=Dyadobacter psychrophilus TaxID=651661 RepID=A0A1T5H044_9BACT|nr:HipA domain-containing protein [Dyadobacter psychrophilus]SKC14066.1 serine/threonine-protein kinase HipA [Dyadobacter psychrophilus]